ncbi:hypothetical protein [Streptomyces sp. NBC_00342]|uniref:hypothetical protein n=1 Tax=Streptomyces sp. NBC_00342 TaxID=2975718 RepID=UPI002E28BD09|nr:hypothetical protein [Streptomyces sp. NBC_00342]
MLVVLVPAAGAVVWAVALLVSDVGSRQRRISLEVPCSGYGQGRFSSDETRYHLGPVVHEGRVIKGSLYGKKLRISVGQAVKVELDPREPSRMYLPDTMPLFAHKVAALLYGGVGIALIGAALAIGM